MELYERNSVAEYWIIDPLGQTIMAYKLNKNKKYGRPEIYVTEDIIESQVLQGFKMELVRLFGPVNRESRLPENV